MDLTLVDETAKAEAAVVEAPKDAEGDVAKDGEEELRVADVSLHEVKGECSCGPKR